MNKFSPRNLLVAAALFGIAAESAWSEEATPSESAAPTENPLSVKLKQTQEQLAAKSAEINSQ